MTDLRGLSAAFLLFAAACGGAQAQSGASGRNDHRVICDAQGAIAVGHALWYAQHPDLRADMRSEAAWQADYEATLKDGVWTVYRKPPSDPMTLRGNIYISISAKDGRMIELHMTQ